jgi:DNA-binding transcriptional regulator LsrR (DeoR family)
MSKARFSGRLDDAARAGWLYYVAGRTQDEIAAHMKISRQAAQRLVALAVSEGLVRVSIDHPVARCMDLASALKAAFRLRHAEVVPADPGEDGGTTGLAEAGAAEIIRWLKRSEPLVMAVGTGRTMKAAVDHLPRISCPQHRIVSLTGNIGPDGTAAYYNVIFSMANSVEARHFPMPLPVFVSSEEERKVMHGLSLIRSTLSMAAAADLALVGIGEMDESAPLLVDGFLSRREVDDLRAAGAIGEICGWAFDRQGAFIDSEIGRRTASAPLPSRDRATVLAIAKGRKKLPAIRAALFGRVVNAIITDETTAEALLASSNEPIRDEPATVTENVAQKQDDHATAERA